MGIGFITCKKLLMLFIICICGLFADRKNVIQVLNSFFRLRILQFPAKAMQDLYFGSIIGGNYQEFLQRIDNAFLRTDLSGKYKHKHENADENSLHNSNIRILTKKELISPDKL